jgi:Zn-finger nucleic acid-binding protein
MAPTHCPACQSQAAPELISDIKGAHVDYHHCPDCHHVWTTTKDGQRIVKHVTPLPQPARFNLA